MLRLPSKRCRAHGTSGSIVLACVRARSASDFRSPLRCRRCLPPLGAMWDKRSCRRWRGRRVQVKCLSLDRSRFFQLLGPIQTILQNNMRLRILKGVPLLSKLTNEELCHVADAL